MELRLTHIDKFMPTMFSNLPDHVQRELLDNKCTRCGLPIKECIKTNLPIMYVDCDSGVIFWCIPEDKRQRKKI